jgi:hypothetical protein
MIILQYKPNFKHMKKIFLFFLLALSLIQFSCKKDNDPAPTPVTDPNLLLAQHGGVSGTVNTTSLTNATENFSFNFPYAGSGQNIYDYQNKQIPFGFMKSFDTGYAGSTDFSYGSFTFNAADSIKSAPTAWNIRGFSASNNLFMFSEGSNITQTNSTISNYVYNASANLITFTLTTGVGYTGSNGNPATVVINFNLPIVIGQYRLAATN